MSDQLAPAGRLWERVSTTLGGAETESIAGRGAEDVKATWGHRERIEGDYYSKRGAGDQKLLQVLLVLVTAKSSSLTCERECKGARQQELINKQ